MPNLRFSEGGRLCVAIRLGCYGTLCAVIQSGKEQGHTAAEMLLNAMKETPVADIPITRNKFGRRLINVDTMKALNIAPKPIVIRNAELVTDVTHQL